MSVTLKWDGPFLKVGPFVLAEVKPLGKKRSRYHLRSGTGMPAQPSDPYESITDCMQDCESHVRGLLILAGAT